MSPRANPKDKLTEAEEKAFTRTHPWEDWFDGSAWLLNLAEHFPKCKTIYHAYQVIRNAAYKRGVHLECRVNPDTNQIKVKAVKRAKTAPSQNMEVEGSRTRKTVRKPTPSTVGGQ